MGTCFPGGRRKETTETNKFNAGSNNVMGNCAKAGFSPSFPGIIGLNNNSKRKVLNGETLLRANHTSKGLVKEYSRGISSTKGALTLFPSPGIVKKAVVGRRRRRTCGARSNTLFVNCHCCTSPSESLSVLVARRKKLHALFPRLNSLSWATCFMDDSRPA